MTFLVCVLLAAAIWTVNSLNNLHTTTVTLPIVYLNGTVHPKNGDLPENLKLELKGTGFALLRFVSRCNDFKIIPHVFHNDAKDTVLSSMNALEPLLREFGKEIEITGITPAQIFLAGKQMFSKKIAIKPIINLKFRESYVQTGPAVTIPDSVMIFSSTPIPATMNSISTETISASQVEKNYFRSVKLSMPAGDFHLINNEAWLLVPVEKGTELTLEVPIKSLSGYSTERYIPSVVKITCMVPLSKYNFTKSDQFNAIPSKRSVDGNKVLINITHAPYWASQLSWEPTTVNRLLKQVN